MKKNAHPEEIRPSDAALSPDYDPELFDQLVRKLERMGMIPHLFPSYNSLVVEIGTGITCVVYQEEKDGYLPMELIESRSPDICSLIFNLQGRLVSFSAMEESDLILPRGIVEGTPDTILDRCVRFCDAMQAVDEISFSKLEEIFGYPVRSEEM